MVWFGLEDSKFSTVSESVTKVGIELLGQLKKKIYNWSMTPVSVPLLKCHKDLWRVRGAAGNCCPSPPTFAPEKLHDAENFKEWKYLKSPSNLMVVKRLHS